MPMDRFLRDLQLKEMQRSRTGRAMRNCVFSSITVCLVKDSVNNQKERREGSAVLPTLARVVGKDGQWARKSAQAL